MGKRIRFPLAASLGKEGKERKEKKEENEKTSRVESRTAYNIHGGNYAGRATT